MALRPHRSFLSFLILAGVAMAADVGGVGPGSFADGPIAGQRRGQSEIPDRARAFKAKDKLEARRWSENLGRLQWGAALLGSGEVRRTVAKIVGDVGHLMEEPGSAMGAELVKALDDPHQRSFVSMTLRSLALALPGDLHASDREGLLRTALSVSGSNLTPEQREKLRADIPQLLSSLGKFLGPRAKGYGQKLESITLATFDDVARSEDGKSEALSTNFRMELASKLGTNITLAVGTDCVAIGYETLAKTTGLAKSPLTDAEIRNAIQKMIAGRSRELGLASPLKIAFYPGAQPPHVGSVQDCLDRALSEPAMLSCVNQSQRLLEGQMAEWGLKTAKFGNKLVDANGKTVLESPVDIAAHLNQAATQVFAEARADGTLGADVPSPKIQGELLARTIQSAANSMVDELLAKVSAKVPSEVAQSLKSADSAMRKELIADVATRLQREASSADKLHDLARLGTAKQGGGTRAEEILLQAWASSLRKHPDFGTIPPYVTDDPDAYARWLKNPRDPGLSDNQRGLFESYRTAMEKAVVHLTPKPGEASVTSYYKRIDQGGAGAEAVSIMAEGLRDQIWKYLDCSALQQGDTAAVRVRLEQERLRRKETRNFCRGQQAKARGDGITGAPAMEPPPSYPSNRTPFAPAAEGALELLNFACKSGRKECIDLVDQALRKLPQQIRESYAGESLMQAPLKAVTTILKDEQTHNYAFTACLAQGMLSQTVDDLAADVEFGGWDARGVLKKFTDPVVTAANVQRVINSPTFRPQLDAFVNAAASGLSRTPVSQIGSYFSAEIAPKLIPTLTDLTTRALASPFATSHAIDLINPASTAQNVAQTTLATVFPFSNWITGGAPPTDGLTSACLERSTQMAVAPWALFVGDQSRLYVQKMLRQGTFQAPVGINERLHRACWGDPRTDAQRDADLAVVSQSYGDAIIGVRSFETGSLMKDARSLVRQMSPVSGAPLTSSQALAWANAGRWTLQTYRDVQAKNAPSTFVTKSSIWDRPETRERRREEEKTSFAKSADACNRTGFDAVTLKAEAVETKNEDFKHPMKPKTP